MRFTRTFVYTSLIAGLALASFFYLGERDLRDSEVVSIASGDLRGTVDPASGVASFKGVPFAAPPVDELRWAPPKPPHAWSGIRNAHSHGARCVQEVGATKSYLGLMAEGVGMSPWKRTILEFVAGLEDEVAISEDCLTLTVWTPADLRMLRSAPRAVMVWFHGGYHKFGAGDSPEFDASRLAQLGVVVVSVNYRLGVMGFFAHPELTAASVHGSSGNYGTLDQLQALKWVRKNIHAFGGDPDRVTIFGESAGAHSVGQLMASPLAVGLMHRAIAQSGIGTHQQATLEQGEKAGLRLANKLGVRGEGQLRKLRALPAEKLHEAFAGRPEFELLSHPVVDGWVLPQSTAAAFNSGAQAPIPLVIGSNADEGTLIAPTIGSPFVHRQPGPGSASEYRALIHQEYPQQGDRVLELYPVRGDENLTRGMSGLLGDHLFGMNSWFAASRHSRSGQSTFLYFLTRKSPSPAQWAGAYHAMDIQFVFGRFVPLFPRADYDEALSAAVMNYWVQFARSGNPNQAGLPQWTPFDVLDPRELELGERVGMRPVARKDRYQLLLAPLEKSLQQ
ncbi:carboxylesterase family protein [Pseudomaricurvus alkylphenolicus]|jgi:para-nitrobenzyl esterase|uniref:carboxylesterase/lipase family protein n=1 Tax=Pseudomaricurvus alkylphenolicus TaxID=1306991 RepID=UPI0014248158|nr:carboxylesterase family protein [Pseudomaricurvus alkylphenolicus]NIB42350.1 carboxylesterase family protein [Pseudomaricurvus alkylphenolicus]